MLVVKMNECSFFQNTEHCFILQSSHSKSFARFRTKADLRSPVVTQQEKKSLLLQARAISVSTNISSSN